METTSGDRRSAYRNAGDIRRIGVSLAWGGRDAVRGRLLNISGLGCAVAFAGGDLEGAPIPEPGFAAILRIKFVSFVAIEGIAVSVQHVVEHDGGIVCGLRFSDFETLEAQLPESLLSVFNRRGSPRIAIPPNSGARVSILDGDGNVAASPTLVNLSATGMLLKFQKAELPLTENDLQIRMQLPDADAVLHIRAFVANHTPASLADYWGVRFSAADSAAEQESLQCIRDYVISGLREPVDGAASRAEDPPTSATSN